MCFHTAHCSILSGGCIFIYAFMIVLREWVLSLRIVIVKVSSYQTLYIHFSLTQNCHHEVPSVRLATVPINPFLLASCSCPRGDYDSASNHPSTPPLVDTLDSLVPIPGAPDLLSNLIMPHIGPFYPSFK